MRLRKDAKVELIRRVPLFAGLSRRELEAVASLADEVDVPAGKVLIREGERGREFFAVIEGTFRVEQGGRELPVRGGSDFFGEISLVGDVPTTATVAATSPMRVLVVTARDFRSLLERSPQIQLKILQALAERVVPETA